MNTNPCTAEPPRARRSCPFVPIVCAAIAAAVAAACGGSSGGGGGGRGAAGAVLVSGTNGGQYYSFDGVNWTAVRGIAGAYDARGVAAGNGVFVWVGDCGVGCSGSAEASSDLDALSFDRSDLGSFTDARDVAFGDGLFVAVGRQPSFGALAWVSADGVNWATYEIEGFELATEVAFGNGRFVVAASTTGGLNDGVASSVDGDTWVGASPPDAGTIYQVSFGDGEFVAVGTRASDMANCAWFSADGTTWTTPFDMGTDGATFFVLAAAYGNGTWVVVGSSGASGQLAHTWRSVDGGVTWTDLLLGGPVLRDVAFDGDAFFAVGAMGTILTSIDGLSWFDVGVNDGALLTGVSVVR